MKRQRKLQKESILLKLNKKYGIKIRRKDGLIEVDTPFTRASYGAYYSDISYILLESFFGSNEESLKFQDIEEFSNFLQEILTGNMEI